MNLSGFLYSSGASALRSSRGRHFSWNASQTPNQCSHFQSLWTTSSGRKCAGDQMRKWINTPLLCLQRKMKHLRNKWKIKGCLPLLLLYHHLQVPDLQCGVVSVILKVWVRTVGSSSGPYSCAGDPSWSGWANWALWSDATPQTEAPQCRRWTLRKTHFLN